MGGDPGGQRGDLHRLRLVEHIGAARRRPGPLRRPVAGDRPLLAGLLTGHQDSPTPATAVTTIWSRAPVTGCAVNATPAARASTMPAPAPPCGSAPGTAAPILVRADPVGPRRRETAAHRIGQAVHADIEERLVQPGVRRVR